MGWFRRTDTFEERLRERLTWVCVALLLRVRSEGKKHGYDHKKVVRSRWFNGYLLGFPQPVDERDETLGAFARKFLFWNTHGDDTDIYVRKSMSYFDVDDEQTRRGFGAGVPDGQRCWQAVADRKDLTEETFLSLASFMSMKMIDVNVSIRID